MSNIKKLKTRMVQKHGTKAEWDNASTFVPLDGELIVYEDGTAAGGRAPAIKVGDGTTTVGNLKPVGKYTHSNSLLAWNTEKTIGYVGDDAVKVKLPANPNSHHAAYNYVGAADSASNASTTNGNTYLKLYENGTKRSQFKISGSGATTVTSDSNGNITISSTDNDTKVTSATNHYAPSTDTTSELNVDASSTTSASWASTSLVTGVNLQRDAKGHVTGVTVDSIRMPSNPNTDTKVTSVSNHYTPSANTSYALSVDASGGGAATMGTTNVVTGVNIQRDAAGHVTGITVDSAKLPEPEEVVYTDTYHDPSYTSGGLKIATGVHEDDMYVPQATTSTLGVVKPNAVRTSSVTASTGGTASDRYYGVELDSNGKMFVNVPWTDSNTHYTSKNIVGASSSATANATSTNGNTYINHIENGSVSSYHKIYGSGATTVTSDSSGSIKISSTDNNEYHTSITTSGLEIADSGTLASIYVPYATASGYGVVKAAAVRTTSPTLTTGQTTSSRYYGVELDTNGKMFVNVPWSNTTYSVAKYNSLGLVKPAYSSTNAATLTTSAASNTTTPTINAKTTTTGRYYGVEIDKNGVLFVNVPWTNTDYDTTYGLSQQNIAGASSVIRLTPNGDSSSASKVYIQTDGATLSSAKTEADDDTIKITVPLAGAGTAGRVKGFHRTSGTATGTKTTNATNSPAVNSRSTTSGRYYGVETDSTGAMYVNVPWTSSTHYQGTNVVTNSTTATTRSSTPLSNQQVYLNHVENNTVTSSTSIYGIGSVTVTSPSPGTINVVGSDNDTKYSIGACSSNYASTSFAAPENSIKLGIFDHNYDDLSRISDSSSSDWDDITLKGADWGVAFSLAENDGGKTITVHTNPLNFVATVSASATAHTNASNSSTYNAYVKLMGSSSAINTEPNNLKAQFLLRGSSYCTLATGTTTSGSMVIPYVTFNPQPTQIVYAADTRSRSKKLHHWYRNSMPNYTTNTASSTGSYFGSTNSTTHNFYPDLFIEHMLGVQQSSTQFRGIRYLSNAWTTLTKAFAIAIGSTESSVGDYENEYTTTTQCTMYSGLRTTVTFTRSAAEYNSSDGNYFDGNAGMKFSKHSSGKISHYILDIHRYFDDYDYYDWVYDLSCCIKSEHFITSGSKNIPVTTMQSKSVYTVDAMTAVPIYTHQDS